MTTPDPEETVSIADKVRFWEEQDKINQELIPRVIRQHELLTGHIADHENLPLVAANAISEALAEARREQQERYDAALAELKAESEEQRRQHQAQLEAAQAEREEQGRQHQAELEAAKAEREEQSRQHSDEVANLQDQLRKTRTPLIGIASVASVVSVVALVVGILL